MKTLFPKKFAVLCLSAIMSLGLCFGVAGLKPVGASSATEYDVTEIANSYAIDTAVTVSNTSDANKTVFPKEINVDSTTATLSTVKYPDGYERAVGDSFALSQLGTYTINYKTANNQFYFDTFRVVDNFSEMIGFGELKPYEVDGDIAGISTVMQPGAQFYFNKVIDLTKTDSETGLVDLFTGKFNVRDDDGNPLAIYTNILLQDVNNPDIYIKIVLHAKTYTLYFRAGTADLPTVGLLATSSTKETLTGSEKKLLTFVDGKKYHAYHENYGRNFITRNTHYVIRYDPVKQRLYREDSTKAHNDNEIFADLRNLGAYDPGAKFFDGFPSKAVKMTISGTDATDTTSIDFTQIGDTKGEDLVALFENGIDDNTAPFITVDYKPTIAGTVFGKFGSKFIIPTATALDINNASKVNVNVYKNYVEDSKVLVPLEDDGTLLLDEHALYTVEYSSYDRYGNLAVETFNIVPKTSTSISGYGHMVDGNLQLGVNEIALVAGENCNANIFEVYKTLNSVDALTLNVDVTHAGKSVFNKVFTASDIKAGGLKFDFLPVSIGDYVITYTYGDNVDHGTFTYNVTCTSNNVINFKESPFLYKNYMYGLEYDVSSHVAYQFGDTLTPQNNTTVEISYDDGATWKQVGDTFVVGANDNGEVPLTQSVSTIKFKYTCGSVVQTTDSAPIVDIRKDVSLPVSLIANKNQGKVGNVDYSKYFNSEEFNVIENTQYRYLFDAKNTSGSATLKTINPVTFNKSSDFSTEFCTYYGYTDFNKLTITLVDAYDPTNKLNFYYEIVDGGTMVNVDGSRQYAIENKPLFSTDPESPIATVSFSYKISTGIVTTCGKDFNADFHPTNNLFYVEYSLGGISGENAAISLTQVSNASITSRSVVDAAAPVFCYTSSAGTYAVGTTLTIFAPQATDFASPYIHKGHTSVKVTVNNTPIESIDGTLLNGKQDPTKNYDILISELVVYKITYVVTDSIGKSDTASYSIIGADKVDPVITLGYDFTENTIHNVTLGKPFTIDYTITDESSLSENCYGRVVIINDLTSREIYAVEPMEYAESLYDYTLITDTCTITVKGMYTVYVYAKDEAGNTTYAKYKLNVQ